MTVLGIADSHDSGSALVKGTSIIRAANEERFTKRKNEVGFPYNAIRYVNGYEEADAIAVGWIGGNALVSRVFPKHDIKRREIWRREVPKPSRLSMHIGNFVYRLTQDQKPKFLWKAVGTAITKRETAKKLGKIGIETKGKEIYVVEHHMAHAASAYYFSGFKDAIIITLDGAGDGLSGTVSIGDNGEIERKASFSASASLGIFYGAATVACDMRYAEDEGKLMSLAAYSYPKEIDELNQFCRYDKEKRAMVSKHKTRNELLLAEYLHDNVLSKYDRESFAYAVQKHTEKQVLEIVRQWTEDTSIRNVAVAGGLFSNVLINSAIEHMPEVKHFFVFPHMGDGGLAAGAAAYVEHMLTGKYTPVQMDNCYFGPEYSNAEIEKALKKADAKKMRYSEIDRPEKLAAELIAEKNEIVLWFQGRMEYGPRALGNRSVLAFPGDPENRNRINGIIKKRPYYQPFASSILESDADTLLEDYVSANRFMTSANVVRKEHYKDLEAASHIDHTTRPQIVGNGKNESSLYAGLIKEVKKHTGIGAVLNTSLNKHGRPIVLDPEEAIWTLENTGARHLIIGNYYVEKL